jgi:DNA-directed RNA polymerase specialized sigma subunit
MRSQAKPSIVSTVEVPRAQRNLSERTLGQWTAHGSDRDLAVYRAYREGGLTMTSIAEGLRMSVSRVSRLVAKVEGRANSDTLTNSFAAASATLI